MNPGYLNNIKIWDFWAKYYDRLWVQYLSLKPTRKEIISNIRGRRNCRVLDIGCGTGQLLTDMEIELPGSNIEYLGIDQSAAMIKIARQKNPNGKFIISNVSDFIKVKELFDIIVCTHAFPYFPEKSDVLKHLSQMLHEGGVLLLGQACTNNLYDRIILSLLKLTTSKADYPGVQEMIKLSEPFFRKPPVLITVGRSFMPSICLFKWVKE